MSPTQERTPLADVDSAWLRMDDATNLMVVTGVMVLDRPVTLEAIRDIVVNRLLKFPRFRQRVVDDAMVGTAQWEPDQWFSLDYHLVQATFPENGTEAALQRFISELMSQPLDPRRPLWQFHFIPHYQGGSALITRIHHCIGDGLGLIYVMLSMADEGPGRAGARPRGEARPRGLLEHASPTRSGKRCRPWRTCPANVLHEINEYLAHPQRLQEQAGALASGAGALGKLLLMPAGPADALQGRPGAPRSTWPGRGPCPSRR